MRLSERLRPTRLTDLIQPQALIDRLERMVRERQLMNMMFHGEPGTGKTSAARIIIAGMEANIYEINGAPDAGINTFRTNFIPWASSCSLSGGPKVCFIDEGEKLPRNTQVAMRGAIEKYGQVAFLITANDDEKLDVALRSRCMPLCFDIMNKDYAQVIARLGPYYERRLKELGCSVDPPRLREIINVYFPDLRSIANHIEFELAGENVA